MVHPVRLERTTYGLKDFLSYNYFVREFVFFGTVDDIVDDISVCIKSTAFCIDPERT